jgi:ABC-2 type transport system permease protein
VSSAVKELFRINMMQEVWAVRRPLKGRVRRGLLKYGAIFWVSLRNNFAYMAEALARVFFLGLILFILTQLWQTVYAANGGKTVAGFSLSEILWYLALTEVFTTTRPAFNLDIDQAVRSGELAYTLGRPYNYLLYQLAVYLGTRLVRVAMSTVLASLIILALAGPPTFLRPESFLALVWLFGLAMLVDFLAIFIIAIQSFWTEDTTGFMLIYTRLTMILGGMLLPLDALPEPLAGIAKALPFSYMLYQPARLTIKFDWAGLAEASLKLGLTIAVLAALALWWLNLIERRLSSNGG